MSLINAALDRTRTTLASLVLILVAGVVAYIEIPKEDAPDIDVPVIFTRIAQSGISPEDAERLIARPVEQAMRGIDGIKEIRSEAYLGGATVTVEFDDGFNPDKALDDVREKIKVVEGELPDDAGEPTHLHLAADMVTGDEGCANRTKHAHHGHTPCDNCKWDDHAGTIMVALNVA